MMGTVCRRCLLAAVAGCSKRPLRRLGTTAARPKYEWAATPFDTTPKTDSDVSLQTIVNSVQRDTMHDGKDMIVRTVSNYGFRLVDGTFLFGPVALFPRVALSWKVWTPAHIVAESLEFFSLLEPKLDLLLIGVGDYANVDPVRERIIPFLREARMPHEILSTDEAVALFNYLNAEDRHLAAALYPPDELKMTDRQRLYSVRELLEEDMFDTEAFSPRLHELDPEARAALSPPISEKARRYHVLGDEARSFADEQHEFTPVEQRDEVVQRRRLLDRHKRMLSVDDGSGDKPKDN